MSVVILLGDHKECESCNPKVYCCDFNVPKNCPLRNYDSRGRKRRSRVHSIATKEDVK